MLIEIKYDPMRYFESLEQNNIESNDPNIKYYISNASPRRKITIENRISLD